MEMRPGTARVRCKRDREVRDEMAATPSSDYLVRDFAGGRGGKGRGDGRFKGRMVDTLGGRIGWGGILSSVSKSPLPFLTLLPGIRRGAAE